MRSEILAAFPDDVGRYIEVFGGAGWVLFGKDPTRQMEVFNDADGSLIKITLYSNPGEVAAHRVAPTETHRQPHREPERRRGVMG